MVGAVSDHVSGGNITDGSGRLAQVGACGAICKGFDEEHRYRI